MLQYFEKVISGINEKLAQVGPEDPVARKKMTLEIARLGARLFSGEEPVAWCGVTAPFALLTAMDVRGCYVEFVGALLASTGTSEPLLAQAEQAGYSPDSCGYHRAVTGAFLSGMMPEPDFVIGTSAPCTGGLAVIENLARHFNKDLFVFDMPNPKSPSAIQRQAQQMRAMKDFVAAHTGRPLDPERLQQVVAHTNRTQELLEETFGLAATVPTPARRRDLINLALLMALLMGSEAGVAVARAYRDELSRKVAAGVAGVPGERMRLMWLQNRIQFKTPLEEVLEKEHKAAVVVDELNDLNWEPIDPDDPFTGYARNSISFPLCLSVKQRAAHLVELAHRYQVHGAINPCHWGCRQGTGTRGLIERELEREGVPVLNLEVDCVDSRNFSPGQLNTRMEAFLEMLESRRTN